MTGSTFRASAFVEGLGRRLAFEFEDAGQAGTPGLIGAAREHPARKQFERLLPRSIGVGSGIVFDSYQTFSRQQDIVLFEEQICPVFAVNETPEATYYPVEGVMSVGEVKSSADSSTIEDAFAKIASVKSLVRHSEPTDDGLGHGPVAAFRVYGNTTSFAGAPSEQYDQRRNPLDQIYGFALFGKSSLSEGTLIDKLAEAWARYPRHLGVDFVLCLDTGFVEPLDSQRKIFTESPMGADSIGFVRSSESAFSMLVRRLVLRARRGRTVPTNAFARYLGDGSVQAQVRSITWPPG